MDMPKDDHSSPLSSSFDGSTSHRCQQKDGNDNKDEKDADPDHSVLRVMVFDPTYRDLRNAEELKTFVRDRVESIISRLFFEKVESWKESQSSPSAEKIPFTVVDFQRRSFGIRLCLPFTRRVSVSEDAGAEDISYTCREDVDLVEWFHVWLLLKAIFDDLPCLHSGFDGNRNGTTTAEPNNRKRKRDGEQESEDEASLLVPDTVDNAAAAKKCSELFLTIPLLSVLEDPAGSTTAISALPSRKMLNTTSAVALRKMKIRQVRGSHLVLPWFNAHQVFLLQRMESYLIPQKGELDFELRRLSASINSKLAEKEYQCVVCHEGFVTSTEPPGSVEADMISNDKQVFRAALVPSCGHGIHVSCFVRMAASFSSSNKAGLCRFCNIPLCFGKSKILVWNLAHSMVSHLAGPIVSQMLVEQEGEEGADEVPSDVAGSGTMPEATASVDNVTSTDPNLQHRHTTSTRSTTPPRDPGPVPDPELVEALCWRLEGELGGVISMDDLKVLFHKYVDRVLEKTNRSS